MGIKKPLIRQAGSAGALIGSAAAGRELNCKIAYPVLRSIKILCYVSLNGANKVISTYVVSIDLVNKTQPILAKAFCGELVPQDPDDEPAAELLKRIQVERKNQADAGGPDRRGSRRGPKK